MGPEALALAAKAYEEGVPTFVDGCVDALEVLGAAKALATYVGVSIRGTTAAGRDGLKVLDDAVALIERYENPNIRHLLAQKLLDLGDVRNARHDEEALSTAIMLA